MKTEGKTAVWCSHGSHDQQAQKYPARLIGNVNLKKSYIEKYAGVVFLYRNLKLNTATVWKSETAKEAKSIFLLPLCGQYIYRVNSTITSPLKPAYPIKTSLFSLSNPL